MDVKLTRRRFLQLGAAVGAGVMIPIRWGEPARAFNLAGQGLPIDPRVLPKYVDALPVPPVVDATGGASSISRRGPAPPWCLERHGGGGPGYTGTTVWSYRAVGPTTAAGGSGSTFLGPSLVMRKGNPVKVQWYNHLTVNGNGTGDPLPHPMPVDPSLHWADPLGFAPPASYPVDPVTGLSSSTTRSRPCRWCRTCTAAKPGASTAAPTHGGRPTGDGPTFMQAGTGLGSGDHTLYPYNAQPPATIWYHDHALGITRLNVYMGLAGAYLITDPANEPDLGPLAGESRWSSRTACSTPAGSSTSRRPASTRGHPYWVPEFFGDMIVVNGKSWPYMNVKPEATGSGSSTAPTRACTR